MNEEQSLKEFREVMQRVVEAETDNFFELAEILGRNPKTDLAGANLSEVNLQGGDLEGANLRCTDLCRADLSNVNLIGADLSRANLRGANLRNADLSNANLRNADLTYANLTDTKLTNISVENAHFEKNIGINEAVKQVLKTKKAIVEDFQEVSNLEKAKKSSIAGFFKNIILGQEKDQLLPVVDIAEVNVDSDQNTKLKSPNKKSFLNIIIVTIIWFLLIIGTL